MNSQWDAIKISKCFGRTRCAFYMITFFANASHSMAITVPSPVISYCIFVAYIQFKIASFNCTFEMCADKWNLGDFPCIWVALFYPISNEEIYSVSMGGGWSDFDRKSKWGLKWVNGIFFFFLVILHFRFSLYTK